MTGMLLKLFVPLFLGLGLLSWHATRGKDCRFVPDPGPDVTAGTVICEPKQPTLRSLTLKRSLTA